MSAYVARLIAIGLLWIAAAGTALAQGTLSEYAKENYLKTDHMIPMRDGKRLFTSVYSPKNQKEDAPILLSRTPS